MRETETRSTWATRAPKAVAAAAFACGCGALVWHARTHQLMEATQTELRQLQESRRSPLRSHPTTTSNYVAQLPRTTTVPQQLLADIQALTSETGTSVTSFTSTVKYPTASTLGATDVSVAIRGSYRGIKSVLHGVLSRDPSILLQHLSVRRAATAGDLEAQVFLRAVSKPLAP